MYLGVVPMLTKGPIALYYGGKSLDTQLTDEPPPVSGLLFSSFSLLLRLSFFLFKRFKFRKIESGPNQLKRSSVLMYRNHLMNILLSGFRNPFNMKTILVGSIFGLLWALQHHIAMYIERKTDIEEKENFYKMPFSLYFLGAILMGLNLRQYQQNVALRIFAWKKIYNFFRYLVNKPEICFRRENRILLLSGLTQERSSNKDLMFKKRENIAVKKEVAGRSDDLQVEDIED